LIEDKKALGRAQDQAVLALLVAVLERARKR